MKILLGFVGFIIFQMHVWWSLNRVGDSAIKFPSMWVGSIFRRGNRPAPAASGALVPTPRTPVLIASREEPIPFDDQAA